MKKKGALEGEGEGKKKKASECAYMRKLGRELVNEISLRKKPQ